MVVFCCKMVREAKKWRYAVRNAKIERYAVRKRGGGVTFKICVYDMVCSEVNIFLFVTNPYFNVSLENRRDGGFPCELKIANGC